MANDLLVQGGTVVAGGTRTSADVLIEDGRIVAVGEMDPPRDFPRLDADGCLVLPGAVDVHTHVFGRVPERAAAVVITAGHTRIKAKPMEGPRRARRDFCLIAVRAGLRHGRINWIDREGRAGSRGIGLLSPLGD